jgi:Holliday junction resolvase RusA-like endonuclease
MMADDFITFYQNPKVDVLFGFFGGDPIPTKQDKFKPIPVSQVNEDGTEEILKNFYLKKPDEAAVSEFNHYIQDIAKKQFTSDQKILKPNDVEVILSISVTESRYKTVDIDNLAKSVLDALNNIAYEDDSQVASLVCRKYVYHLNGIFIGITKLTSNNRGLGETIKLHSEKSW